MADYYPLLARALDALPDRTPALRNAVYERARSALIGQLRTLEPPLPEADIEVERQALDTAIARLEAEHGAATPAPAPAPSAPAVVAAPVQPPPTPTAPSPEPDRPPPVVPPPAPPEPPPAPPEDPSAQALPEPGPPATFVPFVPPRRARTEEPLPADPAEARAPEPAAASVEAPNGRRPRLEVKPPRVDRSRRLRNLFLGGVLAAVIGLIAVAAILLADKRGDLARSGAESGDGARTAADAKLSDRIGGDRAEGESRVPEAGRPDLMVAQRAVLYEENPGDPKAPPNAVQGRATWRLESFSGEQGQPLQSAIRAIVAYPDAGLTLTMTIRKNLDPSLPASHTIELAFTTTGPGEKRAVQEIGLLQLKDDESGRGSPVSGLPVRVRDNLFLIGLSNLPADVDRNTDLLTHKNWYDLAVKYRNGQRAILSFEKGQAGARVVQSAFDQWRG